jgi:FkbM family methyltransferase
VVLLLLRPFSLTIHRTGSTTPHSTTIDGALLRARGRGTNIATVIDVGASDGRWSKMAMKYFPNARYLLIEAQPVHGPSLERFAETRRNVQYVLAAASDRVGAVFFDASDPFGGLASHTAIDEGCIEVPATTIDTAVEDLGLGPPFLIKLDTHGFETSILKGAHRTIPKAALLVIECYNFRLTTETLLFHEMCHLLEQFGFRCIDLVDPMYRPVDGVLWQADLVFAHQSEGVFQLDTYE